MVRIVFQAGARSIDDRCRIGSIFQFLGLSGHDYRTALWHGIGGDCAWGWCGFDNCRANRGRLGGRLNRLGGRRICFNFEIKFERTNAQAIAQFNFPFRRDLLAVDESAVRAAAIANKNFAVACSDAAVLFAYCRRCWSELTLRITADDEVSCRDWNYFPRMDSLSNDKTEFHMNCDLSN